MSAEITTKHRRVLRKLNQDKPKQHGLHFDSTDVMIFTQRTDIGLWLVVEFSCEPPSDLLEQWQQLLNETLSPPIVRTKKVGRKTQLLVQPLAWHNWVG